MEADLVAVLGHFIRIELLDGKAVADDENLLVGGLVDSLGAMRLVAFIETRFGITVPASDMRVKNFKTIVAVACYVQGRVAS